MDDVYDRRPTEFELYGGPRVHSVAYCCRSHLWAKAHHRKKAMKRRVSVNDTHRVSGRDCSLDVYWQWACGPRRVGRTRCTNPPKSPRHAWLLKAGFLEMPF